MASTPGFLASVVAVWRYPLKSMRGEDLNAADLTEQGLLGDRTFALVDAIDGKVVSAKNPRKWGAMFDCRADFVEPPDVSASATSSRPPIRITLPDGTHVHSDQADVHERLSAALGRAVRLVSSCPSAPGLEEYWPDVEGLAHRDEVTHEAIPEGTFFDLASVHIITTSTLDRLHELNPPGRFEARRFRPNIVLAVSEGASGFVENDWVGRTLTIGRDVRLGVTGPCPRCVMTTLAQSDLPKDPSILRTAVEHNAGNVGIYAKVLRGGRILRGDTVVVETTGT